MKPLEETTTMQARATSAFTEDTVNVVWKSTSTGPRTPSTMCAWNHGFIVPTRCRTRARLRSG